MNLSPNCLIFCIPPQNIQLGVYNTGIANLSSIRSSTVTLNKRAMDNKFIAEGVVFSIS